MTNTNTGRVLILGGRLVQIRDAAPHGGRAASYYAPYGLEFQLTAVDGTTPTGDYRGPGHVSTGADGRTYVVLGTGTETTVAEYIVADSATEESWDAFLAFREGFVAGVEGRRKRCNGDPRGPWSEGYAEGRRKVST